jgi:hypothetical protein
LSVKPNLVDTLMANSWYLQDWIGSFLLFFFVFEGFFINYLYNKVMSSLFFYPLFSLLYIFLSLHNCWICGLWLYIWYTILDSHYIPSCNLILFVIYLRIVYILENIVFLVMNICAFDLNNLNLYAFVSSIATTSSGK